MSAGLPERSHRLHATMVAYIDCGVAGITRLVRTSITCREEFLALFNAGRISNGQR
ncbi:MAG TPA: hypothetical protein VE400_25790 [Mycobacterium sp.]|nr:hypothetical protein [Mycobacterium sp.]